VHDALVVRATVVVESGSSALRELPTSLLLAEIGPWPCHVTGYRFRVDAALLDGRDQPYTNLLKTAL
jgi:hypothetical protein